MFRRNNHIYRFMLISCSSSATPNCLMPSAAAAIAGLPSPSRHWRDPDLGASSLPCGRRRHIFRHCRASEHPAQPSLGHPAPNAVMATASVPRAPSSSALGWNSRSMPTEQLVDIQPRQQQLLERFAGHDHVVRVPRLHRRVLQLHDHDERLCTKRIENALSSARSAPASARRACRSLFRASRTAH